MPFKQTIYREAREEELRELSWTEAAKIFYVGRQFTLQQTHIGERHPDAERLMIERSEQDAAYVIGHLDFDRILTPWRVIDFALLRDEQSKGLGGLILQGLQREAQSANAPIELHVPLENAGARLFCLRHGFDETLSDAPSHRRMIWCPVG